MCTNKIKFKFFEENPVLNCFFANNVYVKPVQKHLLYMGTWGELSRKLNTKFKADEWKLYATALSNEAKMFKALGNNGMTTSTNS